MARTLLTAFQQGLLVPGPKTIASKSGPPKSRGVNSYAAAKHPGRVLQVRMHHQMTVVAKPSVPMYPSRSLQLRAFPKVSVVAMPPSIIHPVIREPAQRPRGKATALQSLGEQESLFRFACRHSA